MHGTSALLILAMFLGVAAFLFLAVYLLWKNVMRKGAPKLRAAGLSAFVALWFLLIARGYVQRARFHYELHHLNSNDVQCVQIGKHEFRDRAAIGEIVGALRLSRWFEVNHGGWGDAIPVVMKDGSGHTTVVMVAKYFREAGAVVAKSQSRDKSYLNPIEFAPELPQVLGKYGVLLPDCDTPHGRPCSESQLNP